MYALFMNESARSFVLRRISGAGSFDPPDGDASWAIVEEHVHGFLDLLATARWHAGRRGWKNWDVMVEDAG